LLHVLLKRFGIQDYFEAAVISGEARVAKPDKKIYELVLKRLGVNARECVFVDDRLQNLEAAKKLGFTTVFHLVEPETYPYKADYTIDELPELLDIVEELG
ncbi:MAG: HAD family hydrolase, partial [Candidatus Aenigmarchaeota archaeon]|nr:HAD family hydrolase [Candidatus Aenigmarchaeota archaeon]